MRHRCCGGRNNSNRDGWCQLWMYSPVDIMACVVVTEKYDGDLTIHGQQASLKVVQSDLRPNSTLRTRALIIRYIGDLKKYDIHS
jgi:hypothetical protein